MLWLKRILFSLLVLFVFMGSTGFYVFEHSCKTDGVEKSLYFQADHHCLKPELRKSCCTEEVSDEKSDCCDDELKVVQLDYQYFHDSFQPSFSGDIVTQTNYFFEPFALGLVNNTMESDFREDPPPKSGRQISIFFQVFRC